jgi:hypothetical protein
MTGKKVTDFGILQSGLKQQLTRQTDKDKNNKPVAMNVEIIFEVSHATLGGTMPFPDAVGKLMGAGVEYYHVDYLFASSGLRLLSPHPMRRRDLF